MPPDPIRAAEAPGGDALAGGRGHVALDGLVFLDVVLESFEGKLGAAGDSVADHAGVLRGDQSLVLGVGVRGPLAEGVEELVAAPVGLVDKLVRGDRVPEHVREGGEQLAVLAPEQRPWLQVFPLVVQTESFLHQSGKKVSKSSLPVLALTVRVQSYPFCSSAPRSLARPDLDKIDSWSSRSS